ncbi:MAG: ABC transporter permease subunit [Phycisphaerales bacterium]|nr:ABC transporter permease subunit [Phycisphaerales bacterium]
MPVILRWLLRLGPTNPIAVRLVQNGSRRVRHLYVRAAYLAVLIVVLLWVLVFNTQSGAMSYRDLAQAGASSFIWIAYLQIALICVLAPVFMAGAIAQEASPRTWDILLTTPLTSIQIVLGTLTGRLFFILALLVASLPLFALTQYFGGVPGRSIFASYGIAATAALLVGAIAVALAVSRMVGRRAVFAFYIAVVSYVAVTAGVDRYLATIGAGAGPGGDGVTWMTAINPFLALRALLNPSGYPVAEMGLHRGVAAWFLETPVRTWVMGSTILSVLLIAASGFTVRIGGLALAGGGAESNAPWYRRMFGLGSAGSEHRAPRAVWTNPIAWREAAARNATLGRMAARWAFIGAGGLFGIALVALYHGGSMTHGEFQLALLTTVWGELAVTTLVAVNMAATSISREREDGTLDLLLTTPITAGAYLTGKLRGLIAYLLPLLAVPLGTLLLAGVYVILGGIGRKGGVTMSVTPSGMTSAITVPVMLAEAGLVMAVVTIPFIAFCAMVGMYWSLKSKGTLASVVGTVGVVGVISGIVGLCGWNSGESLPWVGPVLSGLSPASLLYAEVEPASGMRDTIQQVGGDLSGARIAALTGAAIGAVIYIVIVYSLHAWMVKNFDQSVRKLAGTR